MENLLHKAVSKMMIGISSSPKNAVADWKPEKVEFYIILILSYISYSIWLMMARNVLFICFIFLDAFACLFTYL